MITDEMLLPFVPLICGTMFLAFMVWMASAILGGLEMERKLEAGQREEARQAAMWNEVPMIHDHPSRPVTVGAAVQSVQEYIDEGANAEQAWRETPEGKTYTRHKKAIAAARRLHELGDTSVGRAYTSRWSYEFAREVRYAWDLEES